MERHEILERELRVLEELELEARREEAGEGQGDRDIREFYLPKMDYSFYLGNVDKLKRLVWPFGGGG